MSNFIKNVCKGFNPPSPTSITVSVANGITTKQGSLLAFIGYGNTSGVSVSTVTDTQNNTYIQDYAVPTGSTGGRGLEVWRCQDPTALTTSDSITVTMTGGTSDHGISLIVDLYIRLSSPTHTNYFYTTPGATTSSVSITPSSTDAIAIAACAFNAGEGSAITVASPYTLDISNQTGTGTSTAISTAAAHDDNPGSSSITATFTAPTGHTSVAVAVTYQASSQVLTTPNLTLTAPTLAPSISGPRNVNLTTPGLALAAPLLTPNVVTTPQFVFLQMNAAGGSSSYPSTVVKTTARGDTLVVAITSPTPVASVTDTQGNAYSPMTVIGPVTVYQATNAYPLVSGVDSVTINLAFPGVGGINALGVDMLQTLFDLMAPASGLSGNTATVTYPALSGYGETVLAFAWDQTQTQFWTGSFIQLGPIQSGNNAGFLAAALNVPLNDESSQVTAYWGGTYDALVASQSPLAWWKLNDVGAGGAVRDQTSSLMSSGVITWPVNPTPGAKALIWVAQAGVSTPSVSDNGTTPATWVNDQSNTASSQGVWIFRADNITLPASGQFAVSVTGGGMGGGETYLGLAPGGPAAANNGTGTGTAVSTGAATPTTAGSVFFAAFQDHSTLNPETISAPGGGFSNVLTNTNGSSSQASAAADQILSNTSTSAQTCTWTLGDSVTWNAAIACYSPRLIADSSGNGHTGVATGLTLGQPGQVLGDTAAAFNGSTSQVATTYTNPSLAAMTVEAWINLNNVPFSNQFETVVANSFTGAHAGFQLYLNMGATMPKLGSTFGNGTIDQDIEGPATLPTSGWVLLASTYDGTTQRLYVNGVQVNATTGMTGSVTAGPRNTAIGSAGAISSPTMTGLVQEVAIYGSALTAAQLLAHYQAAQVSAPWAIVAIAYRTPPPQPRLAGPVAPPRFATPSYTFLSTDLVSGAVLGELPLTAVQLDCQLNSAGNLTAGANLDDPRIKNSIFLGATIPGRTALWAYRGSKIVWGGILWTRQWQSVGKTFAITGQTFESYGTRRYPRSWLGTAVKTYKNVGQCATINDLWIAAQGVKYGNIGVIPQDASAFPSNDTQRTTVVNGYDLSQSLDDIIQTLLQLDSGPDYTIAWGTDSNGLPTKQLVVQNVIGNPIATSNLFVDYPGPMRDYQYIEDASSGANQWWATGSGSGASAIVGEATDTAGTLAAGWPLLENVDSSSIVSAVSDKTKIGSYANADLLAFPMPLVTHQADLFGMVAPQFGTYGMGDYATFSVIDPRFPAGLQFTTRVIGWTITPPDAGGGPEQITLVFNEQTSPGPESG